MTTRRFVEADFEQIAVFLDKALKIALKLQETSGPKLKDFISMLDDDEEILALRHEVNKFATSVPMPGFDPSQMKYNTI